MKIVFALVFTMASCAFAQGYIGADGPTYTVNLAKDRDSQHRLGLIVPKGWEQKKIVADLPKLRAALPAKFSWADKVTPIRDQGNCGSCWSFSAQATVADVLAIHGKGSLDLSEQFPVSCDKNSSGCNGGWPSSAFDLIKAKGDVLEKDFPYKAADVSCPAGLPYIYKIASWKELSSGVAAPDVIKQAIYQYGPVSVAVSVTGDFQNYASGIYNSGTSGTINHAVNIIGWDDTAKPPHWIMRNSWGRGWGENGYMRIAYGVKKIGYAAAYVDIFGPVPHSDPTPAPSPTVNPTPAPSPTVDPTPGPGPSPDPCQPCTFFRWLATLFGV